DSPIQSGWQFASAAGLLRVAPEIIRAVVFGQEHPGLSDPGRLHEIVNLRTERRADLVNQFAGIAAPRGQAQSLDLADHPEQPPLGFLMPSEPAALLLRRRMPSQEGFLCEGHAGPDPLVVEPRNNGLGINLASHRDDTLQDNSPDGDLGGETWTGFRVPLHA